jgi:hypothetical protein
MRSKRRIGRKRKTLKKRTLKFRGGDLDDPDTKEYLNSKFTALEQKIAELEANMTVQIGYKALSAGIGEIGHRTIMPLFVNKNINIDDFWKYVGKGNSRNNNHSFTTMFLPALHSLPNVRSLNIDDCAYSFDTGNIAENKELSKRNVDALNAKYPGLFVVTPPTNTVYSY